MSSIIKVNTFQDANGNALFSSDGSGNVTTSASGLQMTPAFHAYLSSNQTGISSLTQTKLQSNTEVFDTDSCYDNVTNYRFTPNVAGKYFVYSQAILAGSSAEIQQSMISIYKNGGAQVMGFNQHNTGYPWKIFLSISNTIDMNGSSDYLEIYLRGQEVSSTSFTIETGTKGSFFGAYKIIGA